MDIQISSNFERYLFDLLDRDGNATAKTMTDFRQTGRMGARRLECQVRIPGFCSAIPTVWRR